MLDVAEMWNVDVADVKKCGAGKVGTEPRDRTTVSVFVFRF